MDKVSDARAFSVRALSGRRAVNAVAPLAKGLAKSTAAFAGILRALREEKEARGEERYQLAGQSGEDGRIDGGQMRAHKHDGDLRQASASQQHGLSKLIHVIGQAAPRRTDAKGAEEWSRGRDRRRPDASEGMLHQKDKKQKRDRHKKKRIRGEARQ